MPSKPRGDRPLTVAERQAHQRAKRRDELERLRAFVRFCLDHSNDPAVIREARNILFPYGY